MSKIEEVQKAMIEAMKAHNKETKGSLTLLLSALKAKAKDKGADLTVDEENTIIMKEIKQTKETLASAPPDRRDIVEECEARLKVYEVYAPKFMSEEEVAAAVKDALAKAGIENPTSKDKGKVMKTVMPILKGKADGAVINKIVTELLAE